MTVYTLVGDDTIIVNGRPLKDLADGDFGTIAVGEDIAKNQTGKNGWGVVAFTPKGLNANITLRIPVGSDDDNYLQNEFNKFKINKTAYQLFNLTANKLVGDGTGVNKTIQHFCQGCYITKQPETKFNAMGETEQAVAVYNIFAFSYERLEK